METFSATFKGLIKELLAGQRAPSHITPELVYQQADERVLGLMDTIIERLALPGTGIDGMEHLEALFKRAKEGAACLLLVEHYSNLDLPDFSYALHLAGRDDMRQSLLAIAGMKLNEENPVVALLSSGFSRIVICPSRSTNSLDPEKDKAERLRMISINRAAMRKLDELKHSGKMVLLFPSGTRYRPWDPSSKRAVREIDSYIKSFDYLCFVALNGEIMHIRQGDMLDDFVSSDVLRFTVSPMLCCEEFRKTVRDQAEAAGIEDKKQAVADAIMKELQTMHDAAELVRQKMIAGKTAG
jgi:glycerol-3-phosphate O-acyltransferase